MNIFNKEFLQQISDSNIQKYATELCWSDVYKFVESRYNSTVSAAKRGQTGEDQVFRILETGLPDFKIKKYSQQKWSGDIIVERSWKTRTVKILIEVKNYTNTIPSTEIQKFKRDIELMKCESGLIISLQDVAKFATYSKEDCLIFEQMSIRGQNTHIALLNSADATLITNLVKYLFALSINNTEITVNKTVVDKLNLVRQHIEQMSSMRYEIGNLQSVIQTGLSKLSHDILNIEVRVESLIESALGNIDLDTYHESGIEELQNVCLRPETLKVLNAYTGPIKISDDLSKIQLTGARVIRMAKEDRICINLGGAALTKVPAGNFVFKNDELTFTLDYNENIELAISMLKF